MSNSSSSNMASHHVRIHTTHSRKMSDTAPKRIQRVVLTSFMRRRKESIFSKIKNNKP